MKKEAVKLEYTVQMVYSSVTVFNSNSSIHDVLYKLIIRSLTQSQRDYPKYNYNIY